MNKYKLREEYINETDDATFVNYYSWLEDKLVDMYERLEDE